MQTVTAGVIRDGSRILLVRRAPGQKCAGYWELPGGKVEPGETHATCLARELAEELGLVVKVGACLGRSDYHYDHGAIRLVAYGVTVLNGEIALTVHDQQKWLTPGDALRLSLSPADIPLVEQLAGS